MAFPHQAGQLGDAALRGLRSYSHPTIGYLSDSSLQDQLQPLASQTELDGVSARRARSWRPPNCTQSQAQIPAYTYAVFPAVDGLGKPVSPGEPSLKGFVDGVPNKRGIAAAGDIDESAFHGRNRNVVPQAPLIWHQHFMVDPHAVATPREGMGSRKVNHGRHGRCESIDRQCALVADGAVGASPQGRNDEVTMRMGRIVDQAIHALVDALQSARCRVIGQLELTLVVSLIFRKACRSGSRTYQERKFELPLLGRVRR